MARFRERFGAGPLYLAGVVAAFAVAGLAVRGWIVDGGGDTVRILAWFVGAIIAHDLIFLPLVQLADRVLLRGVRRPRWTGSRPWLARARNHVRVPAMLSGLLFLVFSPSILRLNRTDYGDLTSLPPDPYLHRWLIATAVLFGLSALVLAGREIARRGRGARPPVR